MLLWWFWNYCYKIEIIVYVEKFDIFDLLYEIVLIFIYGMSRYYYC